MNRKSNYIPRKDGIFLEWVKNLFSFLIGHASIFEIDPSSWMAIERMIMDFEAAYQKAIAPNHGSADILLKNECRKTLEKAIRLYVKEYLEYNHLVTDEDRKLMGLPIHDTVLTPAPVSATTPEAEIKLPSPAVVEIHFRDTGSEKKGRPPGQHGIETVYAILENKPADWEELTRSTFATRSPFKLSFKGTDRGKTLYFAMRWENTRGEKGPWSEIMSTIIP
ncbi:MAG: hypothetical protein LBE13_20725 [Bacteroidales bacterium]|jgi:hypothetical protein|nr:hypothetical protein [Bacteroidales bacterium]